MSATSPGREADVLALWDSPLQREAYTWFTTETANLRTAVRWAADHGDLDVAADIATYAGFFVYMTENYAPIAWVEEAIPPARGVDHPRLAFMYVVALLCWMAGRVEAAIGYTEACQTVRSSGRCEVPFGVDGSIGARNEANSMAPAFIAYRRPGKVIPSPSGLTGNR